MTRRRAAVCLLGLAAAALAWTAVAAPSQAAERPCHGSKHCTHTPQPSPTSQGSTSAPTADVEAAATPQDAQPAAPGPVVGVMTTPAGLQSVRIPTGLVPAPHPAGDLTLPIFLVILALSGIAVVTFVLAISVA